MSFYQDIILKHARNPVGVGSYSPPAVREEGHTTLCGDFVAVYVRHQETGILDLVCETKGCALCRASASIMVEETRGRHTDGVVIFLRDLKERLARNECLGTPPWSENIASLSDMRRYPSRLRCVLLPWETLERALARLLRPDTAHLGDS